MTWRPPFRNFVPEVVLWIKALDPGQRQPLEPRLQVLNQAYKLRLENARVGVYEHSGRWRERPPAPGRVDGSAAK